MYRKTYAFLFVFEVLNGGQAKFCVQNDAQVVLAPGNCDNGATLSSSCSSVTGTSDFVMQGKDSVFLLFKSMIANGCNSPCSTCASGSSTDCTSCLTSFPYKSGTTCVASCPFGTDPSDSTKCATCPNNSPYLSGTTCVASCSGGLPYLSGTTCVASCSSSEYLSSQNICTGKIHI